MNTIYTQATIVPFNGCEDDTLDGNTGMVVQKSDRRVDDTTDQDLSDRLILSLVFDVSQLADDIEQVKVCIYGLARQRGLVKE